MSEVEADPAAELAGAQRRMRRRMVWLIGGAAAAIGVAVGAIAMCNRPGPEVPPIAKPYLWRVDGPAGPSYLFGTLHIGYAVGDLPDAVLAAQADSQATIVEADLLREKAPRLLSPGAGRLRLEDDVWRELADLTGVAEAELVTWNATRLVGAVIRAVAPRVEPMDRGLQARATKLGKEVVFLEDRELEDVTDEQQVMAALAMSVRHRAELRAQLMEMVRLYAAGGPRGCAGGGFDGLVAGLNQSWQTKIETRVRAGRVFVAIGCGHLLGPGSIVEHLQAQGLAVQRVGP